MSFLAAIAGLIGMIATSALSRYEFWKYGYASIADSLNSINNLWLINQPYGASTFIDTARQLWIANNFPMIAFWNDAFGWMLIFGILIGFFLILLSGFLYEGNKDAEKATASNS